MTDDSGDWLSSSGARTQAVRAGIRRTHEAEHGEPIFTSSSFLFESAEDAEANGGGADMAEGEADGVEPAS